MDKGDECRFRPNLIFGKFPHVATISSEVGTRKDTLRGFNLRKVSPLKPNFRENQHELYSSDNEKPASQFVSVPYPQFLGSLFSVTCR